MLEGSAAEAAALKDLQADSWRPDLGPDHSSGGICIDKLHRISTSSDEPCRVMVLISVAIMEH